MSNLFTVQNIQTIVEVGGWIVAGVFGILSAVGMATSSRRKENDQLADDLISRLKETVDQQEKSLVGLMSRLEQTSKELHQMQGRNSVLEGLFNGNENSILSFLKQAPSLISTTNESHVMSQQNNAAITKLTETFEKFVSVLQPILIHIEDSKSPPTT